MNIIPIQKETNCKDINIEHFCQGRFKKITMDDIALESSRECPYCRVTIQLEAIHIAPQANFSISHSCSGSMENMLYFAGVSQSCRMCQFDIKVIKKNAPENIDSNEQTPKSLSSGSFSPSEKSDWVLVDLKKLPKGATE